MRLFLVLFLIPFVILSCKSDDDLTIDDGDYLIFGHYYGFCQGEQCVETFKLTSDKLYEDSLDLYDKDEFRFYQLGNAIFEKVQDLKSQIPDQLYQEKEQTFGCPDRTDGGGLFVQISKDGKIFTWRFDQFKENVPEYLHPFMDSINAKIALINAQGAE